MAAVLHNVTPVYLAAQQGHTHVVMELIKAGADVNQANSEGVTPLYMPLKMGTRVSWPAHPSGRGRSQS